MYALSSLVGKVDDPSSNNVKSIATFLNQKLHSVSPIVYRNDVSIIFPDLLTMEDPKIAFYGVQNANKLVPMTSNFGFETVGNQATN